MEKLGPGDPQRIGAYRLLARLGAGGMGQVFLARSDRGRTVAVKLVRQELAQREEFRARFRQEVRAARRVGGHWTAPVLDADTEAAVPWVATGYVAGPSLQQVVGHDHGPLPERSVRILAAGLAGALQDIHAAGLIHRDLKPSNVLVTIDGPRVIDFGIARALETVADGGLTRTGALVGSPGFMAPEQVRGDRVTPAADVFCLGSVLAYAATGALPFGTSDSGVHALMYRIAEQEPDLEALPEGIADLVRACLKKDPAARPTLDWILDRTGAEDTLAGGRFRDPWLPSALVAQLGRHAVQLLDAENPEEREPQGAPGGAAGQGAVGAAGLAGAVGSAGAAGGPGPEAGAASPVAGEKAAAVAGNGADAVAGRPQLTKGVQAGPPGAAAGAGESGSPGAGAEAAARAEAGAGAGAGAAESAGAGARADAGPDAGAAGTAHTAAAAGPAVPGVPAPGTPPVPAAAGTPAVPGAAGTPSAPAATAGTPAAPAADGTPAGAGAGAGNPAAADAAGTPVVPGAASGAPGGPAAAGSPAAPAAAGTPAVPGAAGTPSAPAATAGTPAAPAADGTPAVAGAGAGNPAAADAAASAPAAPTPTPTPQDPAAARPAPTVPSAAHPPAEAPQASPDHTPGSTPPAPGQPGGGGAQPAVDHLPTMVAGQTPPPGPAPAHPGYGYPQQPAPAPGPYGYPQQPGGWAPAGAHNPYGGLGATPPYGPPPVGATPPYGPSSLPARQEPRRGGRSTAALVAMALVVALVAGGSVYALMRSGGGHDDKGGPGPSSTVTAPGTTADDSTDPGPSPTTSPTDSPSPTDGAVPAAYLGSWTTTIDNAYGVNTRRLTISQGEVGDTVLTLVADGPLQGGGTYHCVFRADLTRKPADGGPLEIGPSSLTVGQGTQGCSPGAATQVSLLSDGRLRRVNTSTGEQLTYTKE